MGFGNFVAKDFNDLTLMEELEQVLFGEDRPTDVFMDKVRCNLEPFRKEVNGACVIGETNKGDFALPPWKALAVKEKGLR